jgi:hypothetical protein
MEKAMKAALVEYARTIKRDGWKAGEPLIRRYSGRWKDFEKWAKALGIMLRTEELFQQ